MFPLSSHLGTNTTEIVGILFKDKAVFVFLGSTQETLKGWDPSSMTPQDHISAQKTDKKYDCLIPTWPLFYELEEEA